MTSCCFFPHLLRYLSPLFLFCLHIFPFPLALWFKLQVLEYVALLKLRLMGGGQWRSDNESGSPSVCKHVYILEYLTTLVHTYEHNFCPQLVN